MYSERGGMTFYSFRSKKAEFERKRTEFASPSPPTGTRLQKVSLHEGRGRGKSKERMIERGRFSIYLRSIFRTITLSFSFFSFQREKRKVGTNSIIFRIFFRPSIVSRFILTYPLFPRDPKERTKSRVAAFLFLPLSFRRGETGLGVTRGHPYIGSSPTIYCTVEKSRRKERRDKNKGSEKERVSNFNVFPPPSYRTGSDPWLEKGARFCPVSLEERFEGTLIRIFHGCSRFRLARRQHSPPTLPYVSPC